MHVVFEGILQDNQTQGIQCNDRRREILKVTTITIEDLQNLGKREGLVLQGCGGNLNDWINGINDIFT